MRQTEKERETDTKRETARDRETDREREERGKRLRVELQAQEAIPSSNAPTVQQC